MAWLKAQFADVDSAARFRAAVYALVVAVSTAIGATTKETDAWVTLAQAVVLVLAAVCTQWSKGGLAAILRGTLYSVMAALFLVAGTYGLINDEQISSWLSIVAAVVAFISLSNVTGLNGSPSNPIDAATIDGVHVITSKPEKAADPDAVDPDDPQTE